MTQQIVDALALSLTEGDRQRLATEQTDNVEAYDCFLHGRELLWRFTKAENIKGRELLQRAIELDPKFAPALRVPRGRKHTGLFKPVELVVVDRKGPSGNVCGTGSGASTIDIPTRIGR